MTGNTQTPQDPAPQRGETLAVGLDWLYRTRQHKTAICPEYGVKSGTVAGRRYSFAPSGYRGGSVVVVSVAEPRWTGPPGDRKLDNPLEPGELEDVADQLRGLGYGIEFMWRGLGESGSVGLTALAHHSLLAALHRYYDGCPRHRSSSCWRDCPWLPTGIEALHTPEHWAVRWSKTEER